MGLREFTNEDTLRDNVRTINNAMNGNTYVPRVYVKLFQVSAGTFLRTVNSAEVIAKECLFRDILCLEGYPPKKYEERIVAKYTGAIEEIRRKMKEELGVFANEKLTYGTAKYLADNKELSEYYGKWKLEFPLEKFKEIKRAFEKQMEESSVVKKSLLYLSNLGYQVPQLEYSESTVLLCDLKREYNETMGFFEQNGIRLEEFSYFIRTGSEMFFYEFKKGTEFLGGSEKSLEDFKGVFGRTCEFFCRLLSFENACFDEFEKIRDITEKFEKTFDEELSIM